jgi:hypothetical protein
VHLRLVPNFGLWRVDPRDDDFIDVSLSSDQAIHGSRGFETEAARARLMLCDCTVRPTVSSVA